MGRVGALIYQLCERILGLNALLGAVGIWFGGGVGGGYWLDRIGFALDGQALTFAFCGTFVVLAVVFLVPSISGWVHQRRAGLRGLLWFLVIFASAGVASFGASVAIAHGLPELDSNIAPLGFGALAAAIIHVVRHLIVEVDTFEQAEAMHADVPATQDTVPSYRIIETTGESLAAASIEERRRRLIYESNMNHLPRNVREGLMPISRLRAMLCVLVLAPVFGVVALAAYGLTAAHFLPTRELSELANTQIGPFLLYCVVAGGYFAAFGPRFLTRRKYPRSRIVMGVLFAVVLAVLGRFSFYIALTSGAPDLEALRSGGPPARAAVLVVRRGDERSAFCGRWLDIRVGPGAPMHRLCRLDDELVDSIASGDHLLISGIATRFGLRYYDIRP